MQKRTYPQSRHVPGSHRTTLRPDGRAVLPRNEYYLDEVCPSPSCGAVLGREPHTGDCVAMDLSKLLPHVQDRANRTNQEIILFEGRYGKWRIATVEWWKERKRYEGNYVQYRAIIPDRERRTVRQQLVDAGAAGTCDHGVEFDEPCVKCDPEIEAEQEIHRMETDVEFPKGRC